MLGAGVLVFAIFASAALLARLDVGLRIVILKKLEHMSRYNKDQLRHTPGDRLVGVLEFLRATLCFNHCELVI